MSEFTLDDGRKAEKVENKIDQFTKVTEVYVEPKLTKKLSQRITEKLCVCEREIETIDEYTGEVVSKVIEKVCDQVENSDTLTRVFDSSNKTPFQVVEEKVKNSKNIKNYMFAGVILLQLVVLAYILFKM